MKRGERERGELTKEVKPESERPANSPYETTNEVAREANGSKKGSHQMHVLGVNHQTGH
jgi:hypothetical protein